MKKLKKLFAVMLSLVMVLAMGMTSFAADNKNTITISGKGLDAKVLALTTDRLSKKIANLHSDGSLQVMILQINL